MLEFFLTLLSCLVSVCTLQYCGGVSLCMCECGTGFFLLLCACVSVRARWCDDHDSSLISVYMRVIEEEGGRDQQAAHNQPNQARILPPM